MHLDEGQCWARLAGARYGALATVHPRRGVDAVPVVFAVVPGPGAGLGHATVVIPVDAVKPKRSGRLQRLANIQGDARCVLLVDHYDEDWSRLWWVRVHAVAASSPPSSQVLALLGDRYPQYRPPGSVVEVITLDPREMSGWSAAEDATPGSPGQAQPGGRRPTRRA